MALNEDAPASIRRYGRNYHQLVRDLAEQRTQTMQGIRIFLHDVHERSPHARRLIVSVTHALGARRLRPRELNALEEILRMRPDISTWHMMGALKTKGKAAVGAQQRLEAIHRAFKQDAFINPVTVRAAMAAYYDERIGHHVKRILKQEKLLNHAESRRELAHNLAYNLCRDEGSTRLVHPYVVQLAGHVDFREELRKIIKGKHIQYMFGKRDRPRRRSVKLNRNDLAKIRAVLEEA